MTDTTALTDSSGGSASSTIAAIGTVANPTAVALTDAMFTDGTVDAAGANALINAADQAIVTAVNAKLTIIANALASLAADVNTNLLEHGDPPADKTAQDPKTNAGS